MLEIADHGAVRELKLARPPANALDPGLVAALTRALKDAAEEADAVVVSGREGMFCAGLDVPALLTLDRNGMSGFWQAFFRLLEAIGRSPVPVAFAITGHSPAGGAVLALFGDYRVMTRGNFKIGLNEVQVGLVVPTVIQQALVRLVGPHKAERLMVAGEMVGPERAFELGMVDELADQPADAVATAVAWCEKHLALPRGAMSETRRVIRSDLTSLFDDFSELGIEGFVNRWFSDETQQTLHGLVAQLKKK